jgi:hypothetical protein
MSSNLPVPATSGGALTVPDGSGALVDDDMGDMSVDRGAPAVPDSAEHAALRTTIMNEILSETGVTQEQLGAALAVIRRHDARSRELMFDRIIEERVAQDKRDKQATVATMRSEWGADYDRNIQAAREVLSSLGEEAAEEIMRARDVDGVAICNKPEMLRALAAAGEASRDDDADKASAMRAMRGQWGASYDSNVAAIKGYLERIPNAAKEGLLEARDFEGVAIANRPAVLAWLLQLARAAGAGRQGPVSPGSSARIREIEGWMRSGDRRYWNDEGVQREYRGLLDQGAGTAPARQAPTDASAIDRRISEIEQLMRRPGSEYHRGPRAAELQQEYRDLVDQRDSERRR